MQGNIQAPLYGTIGRFVAHHGLTQLEAHLHLSAAAAEMYVDAAKAGFDHHGERQSLTHSSL